MGKPSCLGTVATQSKKPNEKPESPRGTAKELSGVGVSIPVSFLTFDESLRT